MAELPIHTGVSFTENTHEHAQGPTLPENNRPPAGQPFIVLVTGAGKGLGYAISVAYAQAGVTGICISSRTQADLDKLSQELLSINPQLEILSQLCDTTKHEDVKALADATEHKFQGRLDVVVANAGVISKYLPDGSLPQGIVADDDFTRVTDINYLGTYYVAKYFSPLLLAAPSDTRAFVVITSLASHFATSAFTPIAYNVSKIAVNRMVESMANDHGKEGLLAYAVHPGEVVTPQTLHHSLNKGDVWDQLLQTDENLVGGFLTWLTNKRRDWLSGRYISVHWDVDELEKKKDEIVSGDKLKFRMVI